MDRNDLSNWIIHFVHKRNPEVDPLEFSYRIDLLEENDWESMEYVPIPDGFKYTGEPVYLTDKSEEDEYGLAEDASAFEVLEKILHDGMIKTGWSFRIQNEGRLPTIYGPKSAACFTEMPLYALIEYSKKRNNATYIEPYGIAFLKEELFRVGARPVIYGLSGQHIEATQGDPFFSIGLRTLSSQCGIGLREMYRYVYTNFGLTKIIDWTHEREWRWADLNEKFDYAGMPFFIKDSGYTFSKIILIVRTNEEMVRTIETLQHLHHSKTTDFDRAYDISTIENTYVVSIEELSKISNIDTIRLDELPLNSIPKLSKIVVRKETLEKVKLAITHASKIYYEEAKKLYDQRGDFGGCGWAFIVTYISNSEITQALIDLGIAHSYSSGFYYVDLELTFGAQSLEIQEYGKIKAAEYLTHELGQYFNTHWRWD